MSGYLTLHLKSGEKIKRELDDEAGLKLKAEVDEWAQLLASPAEGQITIDGEGGSFKIVPVANIDFLSWEDEGEASDEDAGTG